MAISLWVEGFLFYYHLDGKEQMESRIHIMLVYAIAIGSLSSFILIFVDEPFNINTKKEFGNTEMALEYMPLTNYNSNENIDNNEDQSSKSVSNESSIVVVELQKIRNELKENKEEKNSSIAFLFHLILSGSIILQGTWFCQIATILYPVNGEPWKETEMKNIMFLAIIFTWHLLTVICLQFVCGMTFLMLLKKRNLKI